MTYNPERAALVSQQYRYVIIKDDATKALYTSAREIVLDTNLDVTGANQLATEINSVSGISARTFTLDVIGAISPDHFVDGPPRFTLAFDRFPAADPAKTYTAIAAVYRPLTGITTITVRG